MGGCVGASMFHTALSSGAGDGDTPEGLSKYRKEPTIVIRSTLIYRTARSTAQIVYRNRRSVGLLVFRYRLEPSIN